AAGAAPTRTTLARGLPALLLGRGGDHLAVHPAGAGAGPAAARALARRLVAEGLLGAGGALGLPLAAVGALAITALAVAPAAAAAPAALAAAATPAVTALAPAAVAPAAVPAAAVLRTAAAGRTAQILELLGLQALAGALVLGQRALRLGGDVEVGEQVIGGGVGLHRLGGLQAQLPGDERPTCEVLPVHERDRGALLARAAGAAGAVEVGLVVVRAVPVHDVGDVGDVDAARGDVGRHQHVDLAAAEGAQRLLACALAEVAVQRGRGEAAVGQVAGHAVRLALGAHEDDRQAAAAGLQDAGHHLDLVELVRAVDDLLDVRLRAGLVARVVGADVR